MEIDRGYVILCTACRTERLVSLVETLILIYLIEIHSLLGIDDVDLKLDAITKIVTEARITSGSQVRN